jgi:hypothetical protein
LHGGECYHGALAGKVVCFALKFTKYDVLLLVAGGDGKF